MKREEGKKYILSLSYGKDSLACLEVIHRNNLPLDEIIHAEIMATSDIPAELPEMVSFKQKANRIIKEKYGYEVKIIKNDKSYEDIFYTKYKKGKREGCIYGFPMSRGAWCTSSLKTKVLKPKKGEVWYIGLAMDEPKRVERFQNNDKFSLPLVDYNVTEQQCFDWCKENDLLSPIYEATFRGGCWFCHNQSLQQLRDLRHNYPQYWSKMLKWDKDSPVKFSFKHTLHDYDKRFEMEDLGLVPKDRTFRWKMLDDLV